MVKVLYLPLNTPGGVQQGMYDAFARSGVDFKVFDFYMSFLNSKNQRKVNDEFLNVVREFMPDLIHMQLQMTGVIQPDTLRQAKNISNAIITNWSGDVRKHPAPELISVSKAVDYTFISSTGQIPLYKAAGTERVKYWQIGYDDKMHYPREKKDFKYDVAFIANAYPIDLFPEAKFRVDIARALKNKYGNRLALFGSGYDSSFGRVTGLDMRQSCDIYAESICTLSISNFTLDHYFSDRLLVCLASGRPTISHYFGGFNDYFADKSDILMAQNLDDIVNLIEFCKNNPTEADKIGRNGYLKVKAQHTYYSRVLELLNFVGLA